MFCAPVALIGEAYKTHNGKTVEDYGWFYQTETVWVLQEWFSTEKETVIVVWAETENNEILVALKKGQFGISPAPPEPSVAMYVGTMHR